MAIEWLLAPAARQYCGSVAEPKGVGTPQEVPHTIGIAAATPARKKGKQCELRVKVFVKQKKKKLRSTLTETNQRTVCAD